MELGGHGAADAQPVGDPLGPLGAPTERQVGLQLMPEGSLEIGDHVIVHVGFAIEKVDKKMAAEIWEALDEVLQMMDEEEDSA